MKLFKYLYSIKYLKFNQFVFYVIRRVLKGRSYRYRETINYIKNKNFVFIKDNDHLNKGVTGVFNFLNEFCVININNVDWSCRNKSKLWRYNLHYFDYLNEVNRSEEEKLALLDSWVDSNSIGKEDAWEPYTVSLRIVNWVWYFTKRKLSDNNLDVSLYNQSAWLYNNIEYHILANHILKNAKALIFSGSYFNDREAKKWRQKGLSIFISEVNEQILADGGHCEKSPMYHCIVLEDCLDVINLIKTNRLRVDKLNYKLLKSKTIHALQFLENIIDLNDDIPLFNDSAFGISMEPKELFNYGNKVLGFRVSNTSNADYVKKLPESGYYVIKNKKWFCIIDCGEISPPYQPGHTHCDILSYELMLNNKRMIVDTGVHNYNNGDLRNYSRKTSSHNTVVIDGKEQSEIWSAFRVARRARIYNALLTQLDDRIVFKGSYAPYWNKNRIIHERSIVFNCSNEWLIVDEIKGSGKHRVEGYVHIHPDFCVIQNDWVFKFILNGRVVAELCVDNNINTSLERGLYFPEFGKKIHNSVIKMSIITQLPGNITYKIRMT